MGHRILSNLVTLGIQLTLAAALAHQVGGPTAAAVAVAFGVVSAGTGALLLARSATGQVSWRNVVAGKLLPWGGVLGAGSLTKLAATSAVGTALVGSLGAFGHRAPYLTAALGLDALALLYLVQVYRMHTPGSASRRSLLGPIGAVVGFAGIGLALHQAGRVAVAPWVTAGPALVSGTLFGLWTLVLVTVGRNARWN